MKILLVGFGSILDTAESTSNKPADGILEIIQIEVQKKKYWNRCKPSNLWDNKRHFNIHIIRVPCKNMRDWA